MTHAELTELKDIRDRLSAFADKAYDSNADWAGSPSRSLRSASSATNDAIEELMHAASQSEVVTKHFGHPVEIEGVRVLRPHEVGV